MELNLKYFMYLKIKLVNTIKFKPQSVHKIVRIVLNDSAI